MLNKTTQTAIVGTVAGIVVAGLLFKFAGSYPILKDAREGLGG